MGERIKIINEYWCRALLEKDTLDYNKFYKRQIEELLDVSRKDNKELKKRNNEALELLNELLELAYINGEYINYDYSTGDLIELKNKLQGSDSKE